MFSPCSTWALQSGNLIETTYANGTTQSDTISFYCSEADPLLNSDAVRQGLFAVLDSGNWKDSNPANRRELQFVIVQDTTAGGKVEFWILSPRDSDVCQVTMIIPNPLDISSKYRLLTTGHIHPSEPYQSVNCPHLGGTWKTVEGAEPKDKVFQDKINSNKNPYHQTYVAKGWLPMSTYILDKHNIYRQRPGQPIGMEKDTSNVAAHDKKGKCAWPKRSI
jgi:hypothetical protein